MWLLASFKQGVEFVLGELAVTIGYADVGPVDQALRAVVTGLLGIGQLRVFAAPSLSGGE